MNFKKIASFSNHCSVICVVGILMYRITALRSLCKWVLAYIKSFYWDLSLDYVNNIYLRIECGLRFLFAFSLLVTCISYIARLIISWYYGKKRGSGRFEVAVLRYLRDKNAPKTFMLTGKWGTGKSFDVERFFEKYYQSSFTPVYRISCFGMSSRQELEKEISKVMEREDTSLITAALKTVEFIPVIGPILTKLLGKEYGYTTAKKGSIFIFDDFERITSKESAASLPESIYKKSPFLLSNASKGRDAISEFKEIEREFSSIESSFRKVESAFEKYTERMEYERYNAAIGLINEMSEVYKMKVIIVCNSDVMGERFIHDVIRCKLNCIEYKKTASIDNKVSLIDNIIENIILRSDKQNAIKQYLIDLKSVIESSMMNPCFDNLRMFSSLLEAFVFAASMFGDRELSLEFLNSLFNSIMVVHISFYESKLSAYSLFDTGADLPFLMNLFLNDCPPLIHLNSEDNIKWIDIRVSGCWIMNLSSEIATQTIYDAFYEYRYTDTERKLINAADLSETDNYNLMHVFYCQKEDKDTQADYSSFAEKAISQMDLSNESKICSILDSMAMCFQGRIFEKFFINVFDCIKNMNTSPITVEEKSHIHEMYNKYLSSGSIFPGRPF